jgi:hypothetical protein
MCLYVEPTFIFLFIEHKQPLHNHIINILQGHVAKYPSYRKTISKKLLIFECQLHIMLGVKFLRQSILDKNMIM